MNELHTTICNQLAHGKLHVNRPPQQVPIIYFGYIESLLVFTPGVSLDVFSLRERHNAIYNEHMPMNELHTAICDQLAHGKLHVNRPPQQGPNAAHPFCLLATLDVGTDTKWGLEPKILC